VSAEIYVIFTTKTGSVYVVDLYEKLIQRVVGQGEPTGRVASGKPYKEISEISIGKPVTIIWGSNVPALEGAPGDAGYVVKATVTSPVVSIKRTSKTTV